MLDKSADHPQDRLRERTSLPADVPDKLRRILRKKRLPKGNVYAVMPDGSFAAFKDAHNGQKVLATFLSRDMHPKGQNVTSEFLNLKVAALNKIAGFADERLAQRAHKAVVKQYGITEAAGEKYWKLKSAIYQKMGGKFTHKPAKTAARRIEYDFSDAEKMASAVDAVTHLPKVTYGDVVKTIGETVKANPSVGALASPGKRALIGAAVGGTVGAASAGEGNRTKGFLLGGTLGAAGGAASTLSRNALYGEKGLHAAQIRNEAGKIKFDPTAIKEYTTAAQTKVPLTKSPFDITRVTKNTDVEKQIGNDLLEATFDNLDDEVSIGKRLGSAGITGLGTVGAGLVAGGMTSKTSMYRFLLHP